MNDTIAAVGTLTRNFVSDYNIDKSNSRTKEKDVVVSKPKTQTQQYNYWAAERISNQVIVTTPLTVWEASFRVATGQSLMCRNEAAAKHILFINGYVNFVGPESHWGGYLHYHPTRNHTGYESIHIWFYD